jgi:hypothetical protein
MSPKFSGFFHRLALGSIGNPAAAIIVKMPKDWIPCPFVKPVYFGEVAEVQNCLADVKFACHDENPLKVMCLAAGLYITYKHR